MSSVPLVSIIINNYNYGRFLSDAIKSAINQSYQNIEVIVVDDGSTDNSSDIIASLNTKIIPVLKKNGGQASAFNVGFQASTGDVIIFLDSDDTLLPTAAASAIESFDENVVSAHWTLCKMDEFGKSSGELVPKQLLLKNNMLQEVIEYGPEFWNGSNSNPLPSGHAWSRDFLYKVFPIPEVLFKSGADYYLFTLSPIFGELRTVQEPQGFYRRHGNNDTSKPLDTYIDRYFCWFNHMCIEVKKYLHRCGFEVDGVNWKGNKWFQKIQTALNEINAIIPPKKSFILVDGDQWGASEMIAGRKRIPFTERFGMYWGEPASDEAAIHEIERQRDKGITSIVFAWTAFSWLETYSEMNTYLQKNFRCVINNERLIAYNLN